MRRSGPRFGPARVALLLALAALLGCASPLERGEALYRQGDVRGALDVWRGVAPDANDYEQVRARHEVVEAEFERLLLRYEKQAEFFEGEGRLAEAALYYRLTYTMDPRREALLERVQTLVRQLDARVREERGALREALDAGNLKGATSHARLLEALDPFDPTIQIEIRQLRATIGSEVLSAINAGEIAYAGGRRDDARESFKRVLELDPRNETALGYLSYIQRFEGLEAQRDLPPPPRSVSREEIVAEGHFRSARQAEKAGDPFGAIAEYEAALSVNAKHAGARKRLTGLRARLHPQVDELYERGKRYFQEEDLHNALRAWRRALSIDPTDERTRENVERAERMLARLEEIQTNGVPGS
jgi:tetratricopeptide (TPR) repeat protein